MRRESPLQGALALACASRCHGTRHEAVHVVCPFPLPGAPTFACVGCSHGMRYEAVHIACPFEPPRPAGSHSRRDQNKMGHPKVARFILVVGWYPVPNRVERTRNRSLGKLRIAADSSEKWGLTGLFQGRFCGFYRQSVAIEGTSTLRMACPVQFPFTESNPRPQTLRGRLVAGDVEPRHFDVDGSSGSDRSAVL